MRNDRRNPKNQLRFLGSARGLGTAVPARKFLDPSRGVDELLFTREKRKASSTDPDFDVAPGGTRMINGTARANDIGFVVFRMNACFHVQKRARNLAAFQPLRKR